MEEETKTTVTETMEAATEQEVQTTQEEKTPSVEELMSQLAQVTAERDKQKNLNDKLSNTLVEFDRDKIDQTNYIIGSKIFAPMGISCKGFTEWHLSFLGRIPKTSLGSSKGSRNA